MRPFAFAFVCVASSALACSSSTSSPPPSDDAASDADAKSDSATDGDAGEVADTTPTYPIPTPDDVQFVAKNPLPEGEQIIFNDWNADPNRVKSMKPDGSEAIEIFSVYRVWSMGVSHSVDRLAFACGDRYQKEHYGIDVGDAIQHTWIYDVAKQTIEPIGVGNLNDECHRFSQDDKTLFVCRRYDFTPEASFSGWRLGSFDLASKKFSFIRPEDPGVYMFGPQPTPDGKEVWWTEMTKAPPQTSRVLRAALPGLDPVTVVRADKASRAVLSPDGKKYAYNDTGSKSAIHVVGADGSGDVKVATAPGTTVTWSPDGTRIAYLLFDSADSCSHIEVVKTDGSQADAPTRVRDCGVTREFPSALAWVVKK